MVYKTSVEGQKKKRFSLGLHLFITYLCNEIKEG